MLDPSFFAVALAKFAAARTAHPHTRERIERGIARFVRVAHFTALSEHSLDWARFRRREGAYLLSLEHATRCACVTPHWYGGACAGEHAFDAARHFGWFKECMRLLNETRDERWAHVALVFWGNAWTYTMAALFCAAHAFPPALPE